MSKLDDYKKAKTEHEEVEKVVTAMEQQFGSPCFYHNPSYGPEHFTLRLKTTKSEFKSRRLSAFLATVIQARLPALLNEAAAFSKADLDDKAQAAQDEAIETIKTIKVEKGDHHADDQGTHHPTAA